ncbi:ribosome assembly protein RRB1 [Cryptococcus wingfieldii CBS 7118]|uniref:Glutamate-rich WD repeat-containing protein 1 n=1 Tax=Cryptococcus wingfieldii CBS 7118 TaxID=1295528 RepID=A0A1E3JBY3_9TREE|nr:ribosome assembly protein RRB1 [Cryptococcus wingfieldii CBS 7118]ODN97421.1 ribosome assembly protein RRB1 [Cryptococcus wingfieldii CBS 7118]
MGKRTSEAADLPQAKSAATGQQTARKAETVEEGMGEFEDRWEDEIESEEEVIDAEAEDNEEFTPAQEDTEPAPAPLQTYLPGTAMAENEQLVADNSVYPCLHSLSYSWPCLSFDVLRDNLGSERATFPHTAYIVTGTQAGEVPGQGGKAKDEVVIMRLGNLAKTQHDDDEDDDEEEEDDDANDEEATLDFLTIPHVGSVNRIRAAPPPSNSTPTDPYHVATFSETGKVHIFDVRPYLDSLSGPSKPKQKLPVHTITNHGRSEGFAVEWGQTGLLTGDIDRKIFLTTLTPTGFTTSPQPYLSHTSSVEDLQWSPSEPTVFASASADRSVRVWDVRAKGRKSVVSVDNAHPDDVNVISWNKGVDYLMVSGGDEGGLKVWDLRMFSNAPTPVASFNWHTAPITSVEWHPTDTSVFAASGSDDQLTLWDLSVEPDEDEAPIVQPAVGGGEGLTTVPPQLLFVHQGQKDVKEVHWHPQIPGMVISTASDSFNVFKTISC